MIRSRRRLRITREGWSFVFILCFIVIGSVLQQINLLLMLAGLMIASLLFNWRVSKNTIFLLDLRRRLPAWAHAGETILVEWSVCNRRQLLPTWGVKITDSIRRSDVSKKKATKVESLVAQVNPGQEQFTSFRCHFGQRGVYHLGPAIVSSNFPLGLVRSWYSENKEDELIIAPRKGLLREAWNRKLKSAASGARSASRRRGFSQDEFYALRPWRSGDSQKWIHWRSSAKHGQPIVKQFDQQTDRDYAILLDLWDPQSQQSTDLELSELALSFTASVVANIREKIRGNIVAGLCGETSTLFNDRMSSDFTASIMCELAKIQPSNKNDFEQCLAAISQSISGSAPVIVISTRSREQLLDSLAAVDENTQHEIHIATWIQVGSREFEELFELSPTMDFDRLTGLGAAVGPGVEPTRTPLVAAR